MSYLSGFSSCLRQPLQNPARIETDPLPCIDEKLHDSYRKTFLTLALADLISKEAENIYFLKYRYPQFLACKTSPDPSACILHQANNNRSLFDDLWTDLHFSKGSELAPEATLLRKKFFYPL